MLTDASRQDLAELPGVKKKSFAMPFGGGEIWFEHLDGIGGHAALALQKLEGDCARFRAPSATSLMAVNLDETDVTSALIAVLADKLLHLGKRFTRVAFVGADKPTRRALTAALASPPFALAFIDDFEKAKEWLVSERNL